MAVGGQRCKCGHVIGAHSPPKDKEDPTIGLILQFCLMCDCVAYEAMQMESD